MLIWGMSFMPPTLLEESWKQIPANELPLEKDRLVSQLKDWPSAPKDLISNSIKMQTIGLYDRPALEPEHWYYGRVMLIGDAAHPAT
jgi:2-polyprenyl-6-methoxyphenol hydroxylase-like FAD-dependent oxidoreductase